MDILVVGAGIMGLSAARALVRRGHRVRLVDQGPIPNPLSSSFDQHRLIRYPYGAMAGYTAMVAEAYPAWDRVWNDLGERLYVETGTLVLSRSDAGWANDAASTMDALRIPFERLTPRAIGARFPFIGPAGLRWGLYQPSGGVLKADAIVTALARYLVRAGATLLPHTRVIRIEGDRGAVVTAGGDTLMAEAVVLAAGAWSPALGVRGVTPSRQVVVYVAPPGADAATWAAAPMLLDIDPDAGFYLVPPVDGLGLKIGDHRFSLTGDPNAPREAEAEEMAALCLAARERILGFDRWEIIRGHVCFYTCAPEERFVVRREGRVWTMTGFSGHGFKFGPLVGERLAEAIDGERDAKALGCWAAGC
jgi:glycine/D-amino acid oxidase-like deaminating enzyme